MQIRFCEKCGQRVAESEITAGTAKIVDEVRAFCAKCAPGGSAGRRTPVPSGGVATSVRDSKTGVVAAHSTGRQIRPRTPTSRLAPPAAPEEVLSAPTTVSSKTLMIAGACLIGVLLLVLIVVLLTSGSSEPEKPRRASAENAVKPDPAPPSEGKVEAQRPPDEKVVPPPIEKSPDKLPDPPRKEEGAERDARADVAASRLEQTKAWFKSNADDPWGYKDKLEGVVRLYARTPAAEEAAKLIADLVLPPDTQRPAEHMDWHRDWELMDRGPDNKDMGMTESFAGRRFVLHTHPPQPGHALRIRRKMPVPEDQPFLQIRVRGHDQGDFRMRLEVDGKELLAQDVKGGTWRTFAADLSARKGTEVEITIYHTPTGWSNEHGWWQVPLFLAQAPAGAKCVAWDGKAGGDGQTATGQNTPPDKPETATGKTETTPVKAPVDPAQTARMEYAKFLSGFQALVAQKGWPLARARLEEALKDPKLAASVEALKCDGEFLALAEKAQQAVAKGAAALTDGRACTLEQTDGKLLKVGEGSKTTVKKVEGETIHIQQDIGGGKLSVGVPLSKLTFDTCLNLARIGLPPDGSGKLALAMMKYPLLSGRGAAQAEKDILMLVGQAAKDGVPAAQAAHLREWLEQHKREQAASAALEKLEALMAEKDGSAAQTAYEAFRKDFAETACCAGVQGRFEEIEKTLTQIIAKPGLWVAYWSGDDKDKFKKKVFARTEQKLVFDWGDKVPDKQMPKDHFGLRFGGVLRIAKSGAYGFNLFVDDRVKLWLDGKVVGTASCSGQQDKTYSVNLSAGDHPIRVEYEDDTMNAYLKIQWIPPGEAGKSPIPAEVLWHIPELKSEYEQAPK